MSGGGVLGGAAGRGELEGSRVPGKQGEGPHWPCPPAALQPSSKAMLSRGGERS